MKDISEKNFGVIIAFLLPGFIFLWTLTLAWPDVAKWFAQATDEKGPTVGGFLFATLASLALGLLISAVRWLVIDSLHSWTGVASPTLDYDKLKDQHTYTAFIGAVENHYRYYQYYGNTLIAVVAGLCSYLMSGHPLPTQAGWAAALGIILTLFLGSRDALKKYYDRAAKILT